MDAIPPGSGGVLTCHAGHIRAGGVEKDVTFVEEPAPYINDQIDTAYLTSMLATRSMLPPW